MHCIKLRTKLNHLILPTLSDITNLVKPEKPALFFGCGSLYTHFDVPKPALFALEFLASIQGRLLSCGQSHVASSDANQCIRILLFNYKFPDALYCTNPEITIAPDHFYSLFPNMLPEKYEITVRGAKAQNYIVETHTLNQDHGSALDCWLSGGTPAYFSPELIQQLKFHIHPKFEFHLTKSDGTLRLKTQLSTLEIKYIKISPVTEEEQRQW